MLTSTQDTSISLHALNNIHDITKVFSKYEEDYQFDLIGLPDTHPKKASRQSEQTNENEDLVSKIMANKKREFGRSESMISEKNEDDNDDKSTVSKRDDDLDDEEIKMDER